MGHHKLRRELVAVVGEGHTLSDPELRAGYERDWTGRFGRPAGLVVRPGDTAEVAAVVAACARHGVAVVPQGGNTGLVGGGVPRGGEVLLTLERLRGLGPVDVAAGEVDAGAGATLAAVGEHVLAEGYGVGIDFGARDAATVGGLIATDAGGARAVRYGTMRARVAGVEAVLADGGVVDRRSGPLKDNAGYDLSQLLVGSEGTLGIVTRARLRLVPILTARVAALVGLDDPEAAATLIGVLRRRAPSLEAADFMLADAVALGLGHVGMAHPLGHERPVCVLVECAGTADPTDELAAALEAAGADGDVAVAPDAGGRGALWRLREALPEAIGAAGVPHKLDVGVPVEQLAGFLARVPEVVEAAAPGAATLLFGHLGDGNVHVNVLGPEPGDEAPDEAVLRLAAECGGTISAEHGVGVAKARWLGLVRGERELAAMRALKRALDPAGILNPGVVLAAAGHTQRDDRRRSDDRDEQHAGHP